MITAPMINNALSLCLVSTPKFCSAASLMVRDSERCLPATHNYTCAERKTMAGACAGI